MILSTETRMTFLSSIDIGPPRARDFEQGCRHHGCPGVGRESLPASLQSDRVLEEVRGYMEDPPFPDLSKHLFISMSILV